MVKLGVLIALFLSTHPNSFAASRKLSPQCPQLLLAVADQKNSTPTLVETAHLRAQGEAGELKKYRERYGTPAVLAEIDDPKAKGWTIDRIPAELIKNDGLQNQGIYRYNRDGESRIFKVSMINLDAWDRPKHKNTDSMVNLMENAETDAAPMSFITEIANAKECEFLGGPKLYRFGSVKMNGSNYLYLEWEELFVTGKPFANGRRLTNLKSHYASGKAVASAYFDLQFYEKTFPKRNIPRSIGELLETPLERNIVPRDPDIAFGESGELRWIDSGEWIFSKNRAELFEEYSSLIFRFLPAPHGFHAALPNRGEVKSTREFLEGFFSAVKHSKTLSEEERLSLLETIFINLERGAVDYRSQVLVQSGILSKTTDNEEVIRKAINGFYSSLP